MATIEEIKYNLKAVMSIDDVVANAKEIQRVLSRLKLPTDITGKFGETFSKLEAAAKKYQNILDKPTKSKSDLTQLDNLSASINKQWQNISKLVKKTSEFDLSDSFTVDKQSSKAIADINNEIKNMQDNLKDVLSKSSDLKDAFAELSKTSKSKAIDALGKALASGDAAGIKSSLDALEKNKELFQNPKTAESFANALEKVKAAIGGSAGQSIDAYAMSIDGLEEKIKQLTGASLDEFLRLLKEMPDATQKAEQGTKDFTEEIGKVTRSATESANAFEQAKGRILAFFDIGNVVALFRNAVQSAFNTIKELDAAMTETAVVTNYSVADMWNKLPEYTAQANELGATIAGTYETMTLFYQQGLKTNEVFEVGTETMKMAKIAGLEYAEATDRMTAALRGFNMEITQTSAKRVADVYSNLAANSASNVDEISKAMTKTASIAHSAGMEFETTAAFLAQIVETTRESAETAGTAMKTVIARFEELKKDPTEIGEVDGEIVDANKIETALRTVGISLRDQVTGQFRELDQVFLELSSKWDTLDTNTQRYIATIAAGSRQQSRFIAMMQDYSRTIELMDLAQQSSGAAQQQFEKTLESLQTKLNQLSNAWNEFLMGITNSNVVKTAVDGLTTILSLLNKISGKMPSLLKMITNITMTVAGLKLGSKLFGAIFDAKTAAAKAVDAGKSASSAFAEEFKKSMKLDVSGFKDKLASLKQEYTKYNAGAETATVSTYAFASAITAVIVVVAAFVLAVKLLTKSFDNIQERYNNLTETVNALNTSLEETSTALESVTEQRQELDSMSKSFQKMATGSKEWRKQLVDVNAEVMSLTRQYPILSNWVTRTQDGMLQISEHGWDALNTQLNAQMDAENQALLGAQAAQSQVADMIEARAIRSQAYQGGTGFRTYVGVGTPWAGIDTTIQLVKELQNQGASGWQQAGAGILNAITFGMFGTLGGAKALTGYSMQDIMAHNRALNTMSDEDYLTLAREYVKQGINVDDSGFEAFYENIMGTTDGLEAFRKEISSTRKEFEELGKTLLESELADENRKDSFLLGVANQIAGVTAAGTAEALVAMAGITLDEYNAAQAKAQSEASQMKDAELIQNYLVATGQGDTARNREALANKLKNGQITYAELREVVASDIVGQQYKRRFQSNQERLALIQQTDPEAYANALRLYTQDGSGLRASDFNRLPSYFGLPGFSDIETRLIETAQSAYDKVNNQLGSDSPLVPLLQRLGLSIGQYSGLGNQLFKIQQSGGDALSYLSTLMDVANGEQFWQYVSAMSVDKASFDGLYGVVGQTGDEFDELVKKLMDASKASKELSEEGITSLINKTRNLITTIDNAKANNTLSFTSEEVAGIRQPLLDKYFVTDGTNYYIKDPSMYDELKKRLINEASEALEDNNLTDAQKVSAWFAQGLWGQASSVKDPSGKDQWKTTALRGQLGNDSSYILQLLTSGTANVSSSIATAAAIQMAEWGTAVDTAFARLSNINEEYADQSWKENQIAVAQIATTLSALYGSDVTADIINSNTEIVNRLMTGDFNAYYELASKVLTDSLTGVSEAWNKFLTSEEIKTAMAEGREIDVSNGLSFNNTTELTAIQDWLNSRGFTALFSEDGQLIKIVRNISDTTQKIWKDSRKAANDGYNRIYDLLVYEREQAIKQLEDTSKLISESENSLIKAIKEQLSEDSQAKKNRETEEAIADKQQQLALLMMDTSGANAQQIMQLQQEIEDAKDAYADDLVQQRLDTLTKQNELAASQRQQQIDILNAQLDLDKYKGTLRTQAESAFDKEDLRSRLQAKDNYTNLSSYDQAEWNMAFEAMWNALMTGPVSSVGSVTMDTETVVVESPENIVIGEKADGGNADQVFSKGGSHTMRLRKDLQAYATGGLVPFTGPAWLDGTPTRPEMVLNAQDTQNFLQLRDVIASVMKYIPNIASTSGDVNIEINVDQLANDYDVDRLAERIKNELLDASQFRNVQTIH